MNESSNAVPLVMVGCGFVVAVLFMFIFMGHLGFILTMAIGFAIAVAPFVIVFFMGSSEIKAREARMESALQSLAGFSSRYVLKSSLPHVAIDPTSRQIAFVEASGQTKVVSFDDVIAVEAFIDSESVERTNRGSQFVGAAVGGALLGGAGLIVGGLSGRKTSTQIVTGRSVQLFINDLEKPVYTFGFGNADAFSEWHGRFRAIVRS